VGGKAPIVAPPSAEPTSSARHNDPEIVRDVLDQFESHRQLLGRVYS